MPLCIRGHIEYPKAKPAKAIVKREYKRGRPWTQEEYAILDSSFGTMPSHILADRLDRTIPAINHMAVMRGLK